MKAKRAPGGTAGGNQRMSASTGAGREESGGAGARAHGSAGSSDTAAKQQRRADLAAIHAAAAQLGMDTADRNPRSDYRAMLLQHGGKTSAADLDAAGRRRVLAHLRASLPRAAKPQHGTWQADKMHALWEQLGRAGVLKDPSLQGLHAFVLARTGISSPAWLPAHSANAVIEALKAWLVRAAEKA